MPISNGKYVNPGWTNGSTPALNATEMNAISNRLAALDADDPRSIATGGTGGATAGAGVNALFSALDAAGTIADGDTIAMNDVSAGAGVKVTFSDFLAALNDAGLPLIETGSYTGTGVYGSANACSIALSTVTSPKAVFVRPATGAYAGIFIRPDQLDESTYTSGGGLVNSSGYGGSYPVFARLASNKLYWYHTNNATNQLNASGTTYYWVAIG